MSLRGSLGLLVGTSIFATIWSFAGARELDVWAFELVPGLIGVFGIILLAKSFRFSRLVYVILCVAFVFIAAGARYTYAEVPLGHWIGDRFGLSRNHFDRVGHFLQGLTVGLMAREVLLRRTTLGKRLGVPLLAVSIAFTFSGFYELVEWWVVLAFYPDSGPEWLGLQGDPWDAQLDMLMALLGALGATTLLVPFHDHSLVRLDLAGTTRGR